ncbi:MAG TPA: enoyl-CoA hydratase/isomerase family protein [Alphaproteobacteria bacterium]|jgi:enoyl-CoA hydratase/carnithine racemase|nr:enoyl-CoA hydratase/isomerase family protein [Alphaproteobacteria bacterium]MDP6271464.1 enoyl-CoA hydratase/isomerase family protein [Alphaproteobacteria bacterium]MDP7164577.1 enoyl-CoA hydratase/isomerase family protein [Alphaproteobacteria bacterium]HJM48731.1 enoyl-CoA hydratase/isomerase family protein [Alphaproteobacteria bacterium]
MNQQPTEPSVELEHISIERDGRIAIVRFDRGDGINALSHRLMRNIGAAARSLDEDTELSAIVLTGRPEVFSMGFDLKDPESEEMREAGLATWRRAAQAGPRMCRAWEELEPVTIAAVEGWCIGGGVVLATACDHRVLGQKGTMYVPEIERGMNMSWGSLPRFAALMGPSRTKRFVIMAQKLRGEMARDWGLVDEVTADGQTLAKALEMAQVIAAMPPVQVRMCKQGINAATAALDRAVSVMDLDQGLLTRHSADFAEGVNSFLEKRPPKFTGG